ncbi:unnamed protein product [Protopolystoma xenopodis]|uniref:Uncharacterized protein n=1 Tax=Protopolystoma xenopodis TaxID=117903 RepID=A0A3S5CTN2_9PLAT|nr:unnamed protein product [Protopolystoma xenopodis]
MNRALPLPGHTRSVPAPDHPAQGLCLSDLPNCLFLSRPGFPPACSEAVDSFWRKSESRLDRCLILYLSPVPLYPFWPAYSPIGHVAEQPTHQPTTKSGSWGQKRDDASLRACRQTTKQQTWQPRI